MDKVPLPSGPNEVWSLDLVADVLVWDRRIEVLTIVDDFTKESVDIVADYGISDHYVARVLTRGKRFCGLPGAISP